MPILDPAELEGVERPELVFAWVAALGTPLQRLTAILTEELVDFGYEAETKRLSRYLQAFDLPTPAPRESDPLQVRVDALMTRGNELRREMGGGEALALMVASEIRDARPDEPPHALPGKAFILRQLKHPDEAVWLRRIYGPSFHLFSVYCPEAERREHLTVHRSVPNDEAARLIERDRGEEAEFGQHVTRTFHRADLFVDLPGISERGYEDAREQIRRYLDLLFGQRIITPTRDEYGEFLAHSAALRSADLSRQVGAAILATEGEVVALGANEVPRAGGGQYWGEEGEVDKRDFRKGYDANTVIKLECLEEVVEAFSDRWADAGEPERRARVEDGREKLKHSRIMNLTEFGRAVHAEMEAILAAARLGISPRGQTLYTTTYPCHNCAKHIIGSGIRRVVYIEPYPKSLADRLHDDALALTPQEEGGERVPFEPFRGVAPRMYPILFSSLTAEGNRILRKDRDGYLSEEASGLKTAAYPLNHIERESLVAVHLTEFLQTLEEEGEWNGQASGT